MVEFEFFGSLVGEGDVNGILKGVELVYKSVVEFRRVGFF